MLTEADVVIIGGGVAGLCSAIVAAKSGLRAIVLEREHRPPTRPGETLHPGAEVIFEQLGVEEDVDRATTCRHSGIIVREGNNSFARRYGGTPVVPWRGYQIPRNRLHDILLCRARQLGAEIKFGCPAISINESSSDQLVVQTSQGTYAGNWLFDGTGVSNWSARLDRTGYRIASPKFSICYGYSAAVAEGVSPQWPKLSLESWGWAWDANLGDGRRAWVMLFNSHRAMKERRPANGQVADGTWRIAVEPARSNIFRIGDSALRMDPSCGRGVLRAMMSAIMATHLVKGANNGKISRCDAAHIYSNWATQWFNSDTRELRELFRRTRGLG